MNAAIAMKRYDSQTLNSLAPKYTDMWFKVRFADNTEEVFEIRIFPRKGQNYNDAVMAVREMLDDGKYNYSPTLISFVTLKESEV